jgi:voltage-gated sodium channel
MYQRIRKVCKILIANKPFELIVAAIIVINSILIGVETAVSNEWINLTQRIILWFFTFEIVVRFIAAGSVKKFFSDGWNWFDLILVLVGHIPPTIVSNAASIMAIRVVRVFRVLRLLRVSKEIKLIISVLLRSLVTMFYNVILFVIFIYLFAIIGVGLFRLPNRDSSSEEVKKSYELYCETAANVPQCAPDPFANVGEAMFTLFRELTGDAWADARYNSLLAYDLGLIKTSPIVTNVFHIVWIVLSAFLLLNVVTGAIINNYQEVIDESHKGARANKK